MKLHHLLWLAASSVAAAGASSVPAFRAVEIDSNIQIGYGVAVADVNGDAKPDVLLADKHQIVWYENPDWTKHVIAEKLTPHDHVCIAAMDIDGDVLARQLPERLPVPPSQDVPAIVDRQLPPVERQLWRRNCRQDRKIPRQILPGRQRDARAAAAANEAS